MNRKLYIFLLALIGVYAVFTIINGILEKQTFSVPQDQDMDLTSCKIESLENDRVALTIPPCFVYGATQADLNHTASELSYESIILNEDQSATYTITNAQHKEMLENLSKGIHEKLAAIPGSKDYKDITAIETNDDFTEFTIKLDSSSTDFNASMSVMVFKMYGIMYNAFQGVTDEIITTNYYNRNGELVATYSSSPDEN